jgi:heat shock protein HspQ
VFEFEVGQIVCHHQEKYRGVVFAVDETHRASDAALKQPRNTDQPWYYVLMDGGGESYVGENHLRPDSSGEHVDHPVVRTCFATLHQGRYFRQSLN